MREGHECPLSGDTLDFLYAAVRDRLLPLRLQ
jgi:hypothetical protein